MGCSLLSALLGGCRTGSPSTGSSPRQPLASLAIYYGWPSLFDGARTVAEAVDKLARYEVVVLGAGLEREAHADHRATAAIIAALRARSVEVFGYLPLGQTTGLSTAELAAGARAWRAMGASGVFFDEAGYDFGTTRARQNQAFAAVHALGLTVFVNAFDPAHLFASEREARFNPRGEETVLRRGDSYLYESFFLRLGQPEDPGRRREKLKQLTGASRRGLRIFGVTTSGAPDEFDPRTWAAAVAEARRVGLDGLGHGEPDFAARDNRMPPRPLDERAR